MVIVRGGGERRGGCSHYALQGCCPIIAPISSIITLIIGALMRGSRCLGPPLISLSFFVRGRHSWGWDFFFVFCVLEGLVTSLLLGLGGHNWIFILLCESINHWPGNGGAFRAKELATNFLGCSANVSRWDARKILIFLIFDVSWKSWWNYL